MCGVADEEGSMKYRVRTAGGEKQLLDARQIYAQAVKRRWRKVRGMPWRALRSRWSWRCRRVAGSARTGSRFNCCSFVVVNEPGEPEVGKKDWALFLCTDARLGMSKVLEVYALRWGIEVYFKEAKQHLGFLVEQTKTFTSHTASIHLCAIRYLMLVHAKLECESARIGEVRADIQDRLNALSFAGRLWHLFVRLSRTRLTSLERLWGVAQKLS